MFARRKGRAVMEKTGRQKNGRRKTVRKNWFLSYLLVLAVPLLFGLLLYRYSVRVITEEAQRIYGSALDQVYIDLDNYLIEIDQTLERALLDKAIQKITHVDGTPQPSDQLNFHEAQIVLNMISINHPNISDIFVSVNGADGVLTLHGYISQHDFYERGYKNGSLTEDALCGQLRIPHSSTELLQFSDKNGIRYLAFMRGTLNTGVGRSGDTVVVKVERQLFLKRLAQFQWDDRVNYYVMLPDGSTLCSTDVRADEEPEIPAGALKPTEGFYYIQDKAYLVRDSRVSDWKYVLVVDRDLMLQQVRNTQLYTWFGLVVCTLLGLLLSAWLAQRNITPLKRLVGRYAPKDEEPPAALKGKNEYEMLDYYVQRVYRESSDHQHDLWKSQQTLRKYYLQELLEKPSYSGQSTTGRDRLRLDAPYYLVVLFSNPLLSAPAAEKAENDGSDMNFEMLQIAILNIFEEAASPHFALELTDVGEACAAIVGLPGRDADLLTCLEEDIRFTEQKVQEHFHWNVRAAVGDVHEGADGIHASYEEALEALSYLTGGEDAEIIAYRDIRDARASYTFPAATERRLIDLVSAGHSDGVVALVRQAFPLTGPEAVDTPGVAHCLAYDITSALIKGANQGGVEDLNGVRFVPGESTDPADLQEHLTQTAAALCERVRLKKGAGTQAGQLCAEVQAYIRENYSDPDLNISQTGLHFNITPAYLSSLFKRETDTSLLSYINAVRLDEAKRLLEQGLSVAKIAEQTGFRDSGALIRVFKKETGMTPGQYRAAHGG